VILFKRLHSWINLTSLASASVNHVTQLYQTKGSRIRIETYFR